MSISGDRHVFIKRWTIPGSDLTLHGIKFQLKQCIIFCYRNVTVFCLNSQKHRKIKKTVLKTKMNGFGTYFAKSETPINLPPVHPTALSFSKKYGERLVF